ncbi:MAG: hypothetical protein KAW16_08540 [candidate division Zixibacteria bacterium]|nr:hypothetical protein [candidate division Zixibacteria bacterium]
MRSDKKVVEEINGVTLLHHKFRKVGRDSNLDKKINPFGSEFRICGIRNDSNEKVDPKN